MYEAPNGAGPAPAAPAAPALERPILHPDAMYGVAGTFLDMTAPNTEADLAPLLVQFLVAAGNCAGRAVYRVADGTPHYLNMFVVIVGLTSEGRKGTSWGHVLNLLELVDVDWSLLRVQGGLVSGEGLIHHVRDAIFDAQGECVDEGVKDKRLLIEESELAAVLAASKRQQNTLSAVCRKAWDRGNLQTLAKNSPTRATAAHISMIGHITPDELRRTLTVVEQSNGFANRFLFIFSQRTRLLPFGGRVHRADLAQLADKIRRNLDVAREPGELAFSRDAETVWIQLYPALTTTGPGLLGSITARGAAHVLRLASVYCVLDGSRVIQVPHLRAATALWDYSLASAALIFGDALGDPDADEILSALRAAPAGMTRTEIVGVFSRHLDHARIAAALAKLVSLGRAQFENEKTKGRPVQRWSAVMDTR